MASNCGWVNWMLAETTSVAREHRPGNLQGDAGKRQESDFGHGASCLHSKTQTRPIARSNFNVVARMSTEPIYFKTLRKVIMRTHSRLRLCCSVSFRGGKTRCDGCLSFWRHGMGGRLQQPEHVAFPISKFNARNNGKGARKDISRPFLERPRSRQDPLGSCNRPHSLRCRIFATRAHERRLGVLRCLATGCQRFCESVTNQINEACSVYSGRKTGR